MAEDSGFPALLTVKKYLRQFSVGQCKAPAHRISVLEFQGATMVR